MTERPLLVARRVSARAQGRELLDGLTLSVGRGELVGIVGRAGAGKTVLLKVLSGLLPVEEGELFVRDVDLRACAAGELAALRERMGFSFQNLALFDDLDATENVAFALERRGVPAKEARARAEAQLRAVGLELAQAKRPHELSGGMKRRLALARAMVVSPEIALFDDPFVGLDPVACARIARLIGTSHSQAGGVTLVAAGDPAPLWPIAHRLVLLDAGRVVADLPTDEFEHSSLSEVRAYLGRRA